MDEELQTGGATAYDAGTDDYGGGDNSLRPEIGGDSETGGRIDAEFGTDNGNALSSIYGFDPDAETVEFATGEDGQASRFLPRERVEPLLQQMQQFAKYGDVIKQLEAAGGPDALQTEFARIAQEQADRERQERESEFTERLDAELADLAEQGKIDPELFPTFRALALQAENARLQQEQQQQNAGQIKLQNDVAAVVREYPNADPYAVELAFLRGENPREREQKRQKQYELSVQNEATRRSATAQGLSRVPVPQGGIGTGGGPIRQAAPPPRPGTPEFAAYAERMKDRAWEQRYGRSN